MAKPAPRLSPDEIKAVIATAWDDRPPVNAVLRAHGLSHGEVVALLKRELTPSAYKTWQARIKSGAAGTARPKPATLADSPFGAAAAPRKPAAKRAK